MKKVIISKAHNFTPNTGAYPMVCSKCGLGIKSYTYTIGSYGSKIPDCNYESTEITTED